MNPIRGIHHITAIASNPQANVDFYHTLLGQRLVKKTINFDDPHTYHLYSGLKLPPWYEARRSEIEAAVLPITVKPVQHQA